MMKIHKTTLENLYRDLSDHITPKGHNHSSDASADFGSITSTFIACDTLDQLANADMAATVTMSMIHEQFAESSRGRLA